MASEKYEELIEEIETKLDEADKAAAEDDARYTADEIFSRVRERIDRAKQFVHKLFRVKYKVRS